MIEKSASIPVYSDTSIELKQHQHYELTIHIPEDHQIEIKDGERVTITASFGIAGYQEDGICPDDLLMKADERLYKAKWEGKNRVVFQ